MCRIALVAIALACHPTGARTPTPGLPVEAKEVSNDGSAWAPWRRTAEQAPRPAYILLTTLNRACLVDGDRWMRTQLGEAVSCDWRYRRG